MEHKGVPYRILQTANPTGWKWVVETSAGRTKTGETYSRARAIQLAQTAINKMIANYQGSPPKI
jgi:hypothetical protein